MIEWCLKFLKKILSFRVHAVFLSWSKISLPCLQHLTLLPYVYSFNRVQVFLSNYCFCFAIYMRILPGHDIFVQLIERKKRHQIEDKKLTCMHLLWLNLVEDLERWLHLEAHTLLWEGGSMWCLHTLLLSQPLKGYVLVFLSALYHSAWRCESGERHHIKQ